ncbi:MULTISPECIES: helix-turn-helix domain-containing protein [Anaerotruncus]|jgi:transcriptional regulator with XRE-family HTH domain|uniref:Helix-turn-helix transcriptional regulator n=1 Tax=Anaerotruncus colihominis TaxID=169435 RepID=A0A845SXR3_9FIRM|nr:MULTISPECIES: helix-turn-helix transcriptional regulator [Anaerotruncus]MCI8493386.1 helix-turn-helix transcriptional regulator [Anaerotruncus sp.]MCR2025570.1 helix-turn-helix domain-containing protein [Anaerotruncus colihominis]NBI78219.1 XRE family transcriptional regulator [Anaerotruncus colihominis]NDO39718.1 helix-turn-helix transcriptional regulator [Anaerotruncus colihominis]
MLERIKALCKHSRITITELERKAGLGRSTIRFWDDHPPAVDKVAKVARYFDVSVDYLIGNTDNPQSHKNVGDAMYDFIRSLELLSRATSEVQEHLEPLLNYSIEEKD